MLRRVTLVRTDVSEERSDSIIRMTRIGELGKLAVTSNWRTLRRNTIRLLRLLVPVNVVPSSPILVALMMDELHSSETSVLTRAARQNWDFSRMVYLNEVCADGCVTAPNFIVR
jgi:hypothetical protein